MRNGVYGGALARPTREGAVAAKLVFDLSGTELQAIRRGFGSLGYDPGERPDEIAIGAVRAFQRDHGLTVDGILGRATLSTLQRRLDARRKSAAPAAAAAGGATETVTPPDLTGLPDWAGPALLAAAALYAMWLAWRYRDVVAAKVGSIAPGLASRLRSI